MKKSFITLTLMLLTAASAFAQQTCKVLGTTPDIPEGGKIYLSSYSGGGTLLDSTVVKDGKFQFTIPATKENMENTIMLTHIVSQEKWASARIVVEPDAVLKTTLSFDYTKNKTYGSPLNYIQSVFADKQQELSNIIVPLREAARDTNLSEAERAEKDKQAEIEYGKMVQFEEDFAEQNIDNILGLNLFTEHAPLFGKNYIKRMLANMPEKWNNHPAVIQLRKDQETEARTAEGQPFVDLTMPNEKGKEVSLSQFIKKNKVTLVDFLASWCGPCRKSLPGVKRLYEKYKKKGFGVVGVSFDSKKENWLKAIKEEGLTWPHMSDLKGWGCAASPAYNIKGIPFTLLITKDGTIVGRNLNGEEAIEAKIQEILK